MTGHSQEELVAMLRSTKQGERVCVVVARQEDLFLPRELVRECDWTNKNINAIKKGHLASLSNSGSISADLAYQFVPVMVRLFLFLIVLYFFLMFPLLFC